MLELSDRDRLHRFNVLSVRLALMSTEVEFGDDRRGRGTMVPPASLAATPLVIAGRSYVRQTEMARQGLTRVDTPVNEHQSRWEFGGYLDERTDDFADAVEAAQGNLDRLLELEADLGFLRSVQVGLDEDEVYLAVGRRADGKSWAELSGLLPVFKARSHERAHRALWRLEGIRRGIVRQIAEMAPRHAVMIGHARRRAEIEQMANDVGHALEGRDMTE